MHELDKLNIQMKYSKENLERKSAEGISYTQEVGKQIKDSVTQIQKALDSQKNDYSDKVRSLQNLIDNSEKRLKRQLESRL